MPAAPDDDRTRALARVRAAVGRLDQASAGWALLALAIWLARVILPQQVAVEGIDLSWCKALGVALERGMRLGEEYAFTYGPLGYFATGAFHDPLWWEKVLLWEVGFKLPAVVLLVLAARAVPGPLARGVFLFLLFALPVSFDAFAMTVASAAGALLFARRARGFAVTAVALGVLAALALVKFTYLALAVAALAALAGGLALEGERRRAGLVLAGFAAWFLALWVAAGQSLLDLWSFVRWSAEIASGYNEGEATWPQRPGIAWCGWILCATYGALLLLHAAGRPLARLRLAESAALGAAFFVAMKAGFVRGHDHTPFFFGWAAVAAFLLAPPPGSPGWSRAARTALQLACTVVALLGWSHATGPRATMLAEFLSHSAHMASWNAEALLDAPAVRERMRAEERAGAAEQALPRAREAAGDAPVDMLGCQQAVLFANGMRWAPRPIFQSYLTFTPALLERNARHLEGEDAPRFVLQRLDPIDLHLPTMEDGLALQAVARGWRPRAYEKGYLLLERPAERVASRREVVLEREVAFGETVELGALEGAAHVLALDLRPTLAGRLRTTLMRGAEVWLWVTDERGDESRVRLRPSMMRTGAILDPFVRSAEDWARWRLAGKGRRPVRLRVDPPRPAGTYEPSFGLVLSRDDSLAPSPDDETRAMLEPVRFSPPPARVESRAPASAAEVDGREVLVVPAPSRLEWALEPGRHRLEGAFGLVPDAYRVHASDGATFVVVVEEEGRPARILLHRRLDPRGVAEDRGAQELAIEFRCDAPAKLVLSTGPGPAGTDAFDWTYWSDLRIE